MPSIQVALSANTPAIVPLDAPSGRVVITQQAGPTPAEIYATADGNLPVVPTSGVEVTNAQAMIPALLGAQVVIQPPLSTAPGNAGPAGRPIPVIRLVTAGAGVIASVAW